MSPKKQSASWRIRQPRPARADGKLKIMCLGGLEEVGRNMTVFEYGSDIVIVDMGLQFPEEDMPGIDFIIPDISFLRGKERNIRGVIITHGHYDHIGAVPYLIGQLGNPPIYTTRLTAAMLQKRQEDFKGGKLNIQQITPDAVCMLGKFKIEFFHINHNIPDSVGVVLRTPVGAVIHTGDWKFDYMPVDEKPADFSRLAQLGANNVLALLCDSTNAAEKGHQSSEYEIGKTLYEILEKVKGRTIVGTFASLLSRVKQIIQIAEKLGKKVAIDGFSMKTNVEIARITGYLKTAPGTLIPLEQVDNYPPQKVVVLCTGAQGEERAVLMRIANNEHRSIKIQPDDTIIFSSSVVPGNERTIQRLKDTLYRKGAEVIHYQMMDVHAGGHARSEDIKLMLCLTKPQYFIPIEGNRSMLEMNAKIAAGLGYPPEKIFVAENGQVMEFTKRGGQLTNHKVPTDYVMVDGLGVGDVSQIVLRDRQVLAADGMVVVIATLNGKTGRVIGNPDIISRGFVYLKENKRLIEQVRMLAKKIAQDRDPASPPDNMYVKNRLRNEIGQFLFRKIQRRPMILPVVIEV